MKKCNSEKSEMENSRDQGFIVTTGQLGLNLQNQAAALKIPVQGAPHARRASKLITPANPRFTLQDIGGHDESDDLETEKAESYAKSMQGVTRSKRVRAGNEGVKSDRNDEQHDA